MPSSPAQRQVRRRRIAALGVLAVVVAVVLVVAGRGGGGEERLVPGGGDGAGEYDPLAYDPDRRAELERRASTGFSDVVYEKSPGGVVATARRTARWRAPIERAARAAGVDPDTLEAIVFLESAGRDDVVAGGDLEGAVGLTQILASTATSLLGMRVDLERSRELTGRLASAATLTEARRLERARRRADERFDPQKSIAGAALYLDKAQKHFGRADLATATYHMGMGNLDTILSRYAAQGGDERASYAQLYFDLAPLRKPRAFALLSGLSDDSSTYLWKVLAAREIMRLSRRDPARLRRLAALDRDGGAGARRLYPEGAPDAEADARKPPRYGPAIGLRLREDAARDFAPDGAAEAVLVYIGAAVRAASGVSPLTVTSAHGIRLEFSRRYRSRRQALAFEFVLDRLQAWNLIAWGRGDRTLAVVAGPDAGKVLPSAGRLVRDAAR